MIHKISILAVLGSILYMVYTSVYRGYIFRPILLVMIVCAALYYITTSVLTKGMVEKKEGSKDIVSYRAGLVSGNNLVPGRLVLSDGRIAFYRRKGDLGGAVEVFSVKSEDLASYSIGKINEYHSGIRINSKADETYEMKCKEILQNEALFRSMMGLAEEDVEQEAQNDE